MNAAQQLNGVNLYNWTQQAWDENRKKNSQIKGLKRWRDLEVGLQRYLLEKTKGCTTKDEVVNALEAKQ